MIPLREQVLDGIVASVRDARPALTSPWEAVALVESIGYTDGRVAREVGLADTRALGERVFTALAERPIPDAVIADAPRPWTELLSSLSASLIYAIPWLTVFIVERLHPNAFQMPGRVGPALSLGLMGSLIVSGGFTQAISRRGRFYLGMKQPGLAAMVCGYLFRLGGAAVVAAAGAGMVVGWYFSIFPWPYLVLGADELIVLSLLWMTCGMLTLRQEPWRVPLAFAAGAASFILLRYAGRDVMLAQFLASGAVLAAAFAQLPSVFASSAIEEPAVVPLPRLTVVLYRALPYFWYGVAYFCFLFSDRFAASLSVAALTRAPFGLRPSYKLGMDLALMTFLFGSAAVEFATIRFVHWLTDLSREERDADHQWFELGLRRLHRRAIVLTAVPYAAMAAAAGFAAHRLLTPVPAAVWKTALLGDAGYLLLAIGLLNALILFSLNRPWSAVKSVAAGLALNLATAYVLSHVYGTYYAAAGLVAGATLCAVASTAAVRRALHTGGHAVAIG